MKKSYRKILISIFIFLIIILLSISIILANNTNNEIKINKEKIYYQIKYLDSEIIDISYLLNNNINWEDIGNSIDRLYNYWNSVILDLNNLNLDKKHLTDFGKILDNLTISIKSLDRQGALDNLLKLYEKIIIYSQSLDYDNSYTNILQAKFNLLTAYSIAEKGNWTLTHESIVKSDEHLSNLVNNMDNNKYSQYNINQAYIAIKELENLINVKDLDIFYFKYSIAMERLENI